MKRCADIKRLTAALGAAVALSASGAALWGTPPARAGTRAGEAVPSAAAPAELDRLLAPIALYPDTLLGQMLLCAANPATLGALNEWLRSHETVKGTQLQDAAKASGFAESYVAIVLFPEVVNMMAEQTDWTARVGKAFEGDKSAVFASIQRLRAKAREAGTLKSTPQQDVASRTTSSGERVIVIEPANPQVVYVPQYNPQTVYTSGPTTVVVQEDDDDEALAAGVIGFTAGIAIGAAIDNDYYYGPYGWGGGLHMYNDAWDDWYDHREDAREDWMDHREDLAEERGDRARTQQEERTERQETRQESRPDAQAQRSERQQNRQEARPETQAARDQRRADAQAAAPEASAPSTVESRGYSRDASKTAGERSGTKSDAFSGYSSGRSERAASSRGQRSRSSSHGGRRR